MTIMTKTRSGANVNSRDAGAIKYRQHPSQSDNPIVGNTNDLGGISNEQTEQGIFYPNIQAAVEDLASLTLGNIGDVHINTTGISPQAVQQLGSVTFTGTVNIIQTDSNNPVTSVITEIMGFPVKITQGDTAANTAAKFVTALEPYLIANQVFASAQQSTTSPNVVEFRHVDYRNHSYTSLKKYGLQIDIAMTSPARNGVGTWTKLGQESKTFEGATDATILHYFQRTS